MIEVTQKNRKGAIQILAQYKTEKEFGEAHQPSDIPTLFSTSPVIMGHKEIYVTSINMNYRVAVFAQVAYNEKGKILDVGHLVGLARKYNKRYLHYKKYYYMGSGCGFGGGRWRDVYYRQMKTTQERRWANAWDGEEFAPKCRPSRNPTNLPNAWDDFHRFNQKNWKNFRNHQWKE